MNTPPPNNGAPGGAADAFATREPVDPHDGWMDRLTRTKFGDVRPTFSNLCAIFEHHSLYRGRLWLNDMNMVAMIDSRPVTDADYLEAREWVSSSVTFELNCATSEIAQAFERVASKRRCHPVQQFLTGLRWDGAPRLDTLCARAIGNTGELEAMMLRKWFISAVARAMRPGRKVDTMLVLQGKQGARKSTFFAVLGGEWFTDSLDTGNGLDKDAIITAHGHWLCELAELDGITRKQDNEHLKALLSRCFDDVRRPYEAKQRKLERGFVFCGTANSDEILRDTTGSRRQWIVEVTGAIDTELVRLERAQLWAEAFEAYRAGETWWFDDCDAERIEHAQRAFAATDSRADRVRTWLLSAAGDVTTRRVLVECLGYEDRQIDRKAETAVGLIMRRLGWDRRRVRHDGELGYVYERRESASVPTSLEGGAGGGNMIRRSQNAVVPTVPTVPTESGKSSEEQLSGSDTPSPNYVPKVGVSGGNVGTAADEQQSRIQNAADCVPILAPSSSGVGTSSATLASGAANDDELGAHITVDRGEAEPFDVDVFEQHRDGRRVLVHKAGKGSP
jgi:predicted P-loop ATPase